ncbi:MAG: Na+/H+ antiporter subunit E [Pseudomonadota bacterium]
MNTFVANLILTVLWAFFMGSFDTLTLGGGFVLSYALLWLLQPLMGERTSYFLQVWYWCKLIVLFLYELVISSAAVLWDIVTPDHRAQPAIIDVPLDVRSDAGILLVTNLVSLTPGTLCIDVSPDRSTLRIHAMFADDPDAICHDIKSGMEKWVMDALGEHPDPEPEGA